MSNRSQNPLSPDFSEIQLEHIATVNRIISDRAERAFSDGLLFEDVCVDGVTVIAGFNHRDSMYVDVTYAFDLRGDGIAADINSSPDPYI